MKQLRLLALSLLVCVASFAQEASIKPNDALILENIPPVPASIADKAAKYTDYRTATMFGWHPTKREILIGTRFADTVQVHQVAMPGGARTQLTFFGDRISDASYLPHKGDYFLFRKDVGGGEWFQIFRFDVASGDVTMLTDGKSRNSEFIWSNKGDRIAYASTLRNNADLDFYVIDPSSKPATWKPITENQGGGWQIHDWSPDDKMLLAAEYVSINESYLWLVDAATGAKKALTPKGTEKVAYQAIGFSADGKGVYLATDKGSEFSRLAYLDIATGSLKFLNNDNWDIEGSALSEDRSLLAYVINENGLSTLHVLDLKSDKARSIPKLPAGQISALNWSENNRDLAFSLNSAQSPSDVYSVDVQTAKLERWTYSETGGIPSKNFVEPTLVKWKSFDGKEISGWMYAPKVKPTSGKYPVVINIHGGPEGQSRPGFLGRTNYFINELGVAIIYPNVRGSTGYGKTFSQLDNGFKREDTYKDIGALLDWLGQQPNLNAQRVMVTGGSYGGHMTLAVATLYSDLIACSVDIVGMSNLVTFLEHTESYRRDLRRVEYGDERDPKMR